MNIAKALEALVDRCVDVIARDELATRLAEGRPLRVKLGIDPSGPLLHLGHAVVLRKLRQFQDLGHQAILIVGDFTARIGDPTGLSTSRKPRTQAEISADMQTYAAQAALILDVEKAVVRYNSEWLAPISFADVIRLSARVTVARMLERDDFSKRFKSGVPIGLHEFLYPLSQAYDSVATQADVELGGTEQLFNLLMGRRLQEEEGQRPQICMTLPILEGTDGVQRMGKSLDNYIALQDEPSVMFGKVMSIPDQLIARYWQLATTRPKPEYEAIERDMQANELSARDSKVQLAAEIVRLYHGPALARSAHDHFEKTVVRKELPDDMPCLPLPPDEASLMLGPLLVKLGWAASNREAARLVRQGAIKVDGKRIDDEKHRESSWRDKVLQKGNHQFARLGAEQKR
ncbi:MAG: tyrosine--tRNA ligase [Candidatus Eremiobacter antarcticus]|nr:tyrosine--tRNA ligase [Candidatus Eremiobacteraeota bacterium]PZR61856.1 MAG: tyrosine--tRNA ligase [Candidatus Eremiobacter sp. RRmetagenome_bin22]